MVEPMSIVQTKMVEVPAVLGMNDKIALLNLHLKALQHDGFMILSTKVVDESSFLIEFKQVPK